MRLSAIFGLILIAGAFLGQAMLNGSLFDYVYLPALLVTCFGTLGLLYLTYGALDTLTALGGLRWLFATPSGKTDLSRPARVLSGAIGCAYACGATGTAIYIFKVLLHAASMRQFTWEPSPLLVSLLPLFYAMLLAEFLLRPAVRRLTDLSGE